MVAATLWLSGCATQPLVPLGPHLDWATEGAALPVEVEIADARDAEVRVDQMPSWRAAFVGAAREGVRRLGDASFDVAPALALERSVAATLARLDWGGASTGPVRLVGTLREFEATQPIRREFNVLRPGGLRTRFGPVRARILADFEWDGPGGTGNERIDIELYAKSGHPGDLAGDVLARASEEIAVRLWNRLTTTEVAARLPVRVLDGCGLSRDAQHALAQGLVEVFRREAGLGLEIEVVPWPLAPIDVSAQAALEAVPASGSGATLALVRLSADWLGAPHAGLARPFARRAVVACAGGEAPRQAALHELAHLLGAVHVTERHSIMYPTAVFDAKLFDPLNRRILRATRGVRFEGPVPAKTVRRLLAIYATAERHPEFVDSSGVEAARRALHRRSDDGR